MVSNTLSRALLRAAVVLLVGSTVLLVGSTKGFGRATVNSIGVTQADHFHKADDFHHAPGSIIGKDTPHLIPDEVAIGLLFKTIADLNDRQMLPSYLVRMEHIVGYSFSSGDRNAVIAAALAYREHTSVAGFGGSATGISAAEYGQRWKQEAREQWLSLDSVMTPLGKASLRRYIDNYYKSTIKILAPVH